MGRKVKTENRDAILKASYRLFLTKGYENASILEIAAQAGINQRIIFRHFKRKEDILGAVIENIERKMLEYIAPCFKDNQLVNYCAFNLMWVEFSLIHADYFRLRSSLIKYPKSAMMAFINVFTLSYPPSKDWRYDKDTRIKWFYILGGTQMLQYEFATNFSGYSLSTANSDFMHNYEKNCLSEQATADFRDYMLYAIRQNIRALTPTTEEDESAIIKEAQKHLSSIDIGGFRRYYELELGYFSDTGE